MARKFIQPLLVVLVLGAGFGAFGYFRSTKPEAERVERPSQGMLVEVIGVHAKDHEVHLLAHGTVIPATRVVVQPEVAGRVLWRNSDLVPGGTLKKGSALVRIDPRDYQLQLEARKAEVSKAELELQLEQSRQQVAKREWELFGERTQRSGSGGKPNAVAANGSGVDGSEQKPAEEDVLALRGPQLRTAQVGVQSAASALDRAKLDLSRTSIVAPFNALVIDEQVNVGQLVNPQTQLATIVGTDKYWVQVSIPMEALSYISIPGSRGAKEGSLAKVSQRVGEDHVERTGRVSRLLPDLDSGGSMARILVEIEDPLGLELPGEPLPVLINSYVDVELAATTLEKVIEVPRAAVRDGNRAFVVDGEGRLRIRDLQIAWRSPDSVLVRAGLADGDEVVVSRIAAPVDGMQVRKAPAPSTKSATPPTSAASEPPATARAPAPPGQAADEPTKPSVKASSTDGHAP